MVTIDSQVGLYEIADLAHWTISPNPSNGQFSISVDETLTAESIEIVNGLGQHLMQVEIKANTQVNLTSAGVYYAILHTANGKSVKKIIVR